MQVFNATSQQLETVDWSVDDNSEIVARFKDGSFLKFPAGLTKAELQKQVDAHKESNEGQEVITPEMEQKAQEAKEQSEKLIAELGGKTNAPKTNG